MLDPQKGIVGISIGPGKVFITQLKLTEEKWEIEKSISVDIAQDMVQDGLIVDVEGFAQILKKAFKDNEIKARQAIAALSGAGAIMRAIEMPEMPPAQMKEALKTEIDKYMLAGEEAIIDYYPVAKEWVFLIALKKSIASALLAAMEKAGLNLIGIDIFPLAVLRALGRGNIDLTSKNATILVLVGDKKTDMGAVKGGVLAFSRSVETVEVPELIKEIKIINTYWGEQFPGIPIEKFVVLGDTEKAEDLRKKLPEELGSAESGKPLGMMPPDFSLSRSASMGLAMRGAEGEFSFDINLLPPEKFRKIKFERRFLASFISVSAILLVLFLMNSLFAAMINSYEKKLMPVKKELAASPEILTAVENINEERMHILDNLNQKKEFIAKVEFTPWAKVLTDVKNFIPKEVWRTDISTKKDETVVLQGKSFSQDAVYRYVRLLSFSDYFHEPKLAVIRGKEKEGRSVFDFKIICPLIKGSASE
ncbi:MAG: pilus assembly protein PilM [Candidatus Omnitrophota bacterium]